jgi:hypothetical protein
VKCTPPISMESSASPASFGAMSDLLHFQGSHCSMEQVILVTMTRRQAAAESFARLSPLS